MIILGIDTATAQVGVALGGHEGILASIRSAKGRRHAESLIPSVEFALAQCEQTYGDVGAIAVDIGPGLFTGLRVGLASAKALAVSLRIPMIGISSLDLLAFPLRFGVKPVVSVLDARRGEVFHATYRQVPGGLQRVAGPGCCSPEELSFELQATGDGCLLVGDGALRYRECFESISGLEIADSSMSFPSAASLVHLAHAQALREEWVQASEIQPMYLRKPDAEVNWQSRSSA